MRKKLDTILEWSLCTILAIMVIDVTWQVLSRYVVGSPSTFTDELASFLLVWLGILGGAYVYGRGEHLAISFIAEKFSIVSQRRTRLFVEFVVLMFSFWVMLVGGVWMVYTRFLLGVRSAALELNWGYVYLVLPLSGLLIIIYVVDNLLKLKKSA